MRQHGNAVPIYKEGPVSKHYALKREKKLKGWTREKKLGLITKYFSQQK